MPTMMMAAIVVSTRSAMRFLALTMRVTASMRMWRPVYVA